MANALLDGQKISLQGELKFPTIVALRKKVEGLLSGLSGEITVDFSGVTSVDSSAVSFWLCCMRYTQTSGAQLKAVDMPDEMQGIVELVGLADKIN